MAYNYTSTARKESKIFPGVFYTLNRMSEARRVQLRLRIAEPTAEVRRLLREMSKIEQVPEENRDEQTMEQLVTLADQMDVLSTQKIDPEWLRWGCKKVEGLMIDDQEADVEMLISEGPPALFDEIVGEIKKLAQLSGDEEKNSESPTTSGEPTGGTTPSTSAENAASGDISESTETASTTQS